MLYKYVAPLEEYLVFLKPGKDVDPCNDLEISRGKGGGRSEGRSRCGGRSTTEARSKGASAVKFNLVSQEFK